MALFAELETDMFFFYSGLETSKPNSCLSGQEEEQPETGGFDNTCLSPVENSKGGRATAPAFVQNIL